MEKTDTRNIIALILMVLSFVWPPLILALVIFLIRRYACDVDRIKTEEGAELDYYKDRLKSKKPEECK